MSRLVKTIFEVERRFKPGADLIRRLEANDGAPVAFPSMNFLGERNIRDRYYDRDGILAARGIWLRKRNGTWQAKMRCRPPTGKNQVCRYYAEIRSAAGIKALVEKHARVVGSEESAFGLSEIARFNTVRRAWKVDDDFQVVIDETNFGHCVGEVEMRKECELSEGEAPEQSAEGATGEMGDRIVSFVNKYKWAFSTENPVSKISAFFEEKSRKEAIRAFWAGKQNK